MVKPVAQDYDALISAPFGAVGINIQSDYVIGVTLLPISQPSHQATDQCAQHVRYQVERYLADAATALEIPYAVSGTPFQKRVWKAISEIPVGQVLTYSELAQKVGSGPRAVANVCGANKVPLLIPCHRVVAKNGLGGFMQGVDGGLKIKQWLLAHESK
jgi:methylated-DNA-[protein]-cysteine S-methyltransferase